MRVRQVRPADTATLVRLIRALAEYEHAADQCSVTDEQLRAALFAPDAAVFGHVAEVEDSGGRPTVVGMALWYLTFSTWDGVHGIHLEDLFVDPDRRGLGAGTALLAALARICVDRGYTRLEWEVLDWNAPALEFYRGFGAAARTDWIPHRVTGTALADLADAANPRVGS